MASKNGRASESVKLTIKQAAAYLDMPTSTLRHALRMRDEFSTLGAEGKREYRSDIIEVRSIEGTDYEVVYIDQTALDSYRENRAKERTVVGNRRGPKSDGRLSYAVRLSQSEFDAFCAGTLNTAGIPIKRVSQRKNTATQTSEEAQESFALDLS